jgi:predicted nucleotide-binding protein
MPNEITDSSNANLIEFVKKRIEVLKGFDPGQILDKNDPIIQKLSIMLDRVLIEALGQDTPGYEKYKSLMDIGRAGAGAGVSMTDFRKGLIKNKTEAIAALESIVKALAEREEPPVRSAVPPVASAPGQPPKKVFLACENDPELKKSVARLLEDLGIVPVMLDRGRDRSRTIMEAVEASPDAKVAIVGVVDAVEEPDGRPAGPQAVQNAVFGLGYLMGRLGRGKVIALKVAEDRDVAEIKGVKYVYLDEQGRWIASLVKEIGAAGIYLDQARVSRVLKQG